MLAKYLSAISEAVALDTCPHQDHMTTFRPLPIPFRKSRVAWYQAVRSGFPRSDALGMP